jgi:hypothetical protein
LKTVAQDREKDRSRKWKEGYTAAVAVSGRYIAFVLGAKVE